ncbi:hypothetical protein FWF89_03075 [Candidatus Saccharibacteria bacterium]|nr:hypothetical protein [Candidatus Saccharibacteria bacterium]
MEKEINEVNGMMPGGDIPKTEEVAVKEDGFIGGQASNSGANSVGGSSNEELMKQIVSLQQQMVDQQKKGLDNVGERRVNKYAVFLFILGGILLLWFFSSLVVLAQVSIWSSSSEFLVHDHVLMPIAATLLILAGIQLMMKKYRARMMVGVALGMTALWNIVAAIHGYIVETSRGSYWSLSGGNSGMAIMLAVVRLMIYGLIIGGLALWFYKSKSIQDTIAGWTK